MDRMENKDSRIQWKKIKPTDLARNSVRAQHSTNPVVLRHTNSQVGYPIQWKPVSTSRKNIREVRCLTCSFVHNVGMIDATENAIDSVQGATASCRANVLSVIPHKKKQESALTGQSVVGSNWDQPQPAQTPSPPYERKCFNSNSFPSIPASSVGPKEGGDRINCSEGELVKCKPADWQKETIDDKGNLDNIVSTVQSKNSEATGAITNQGSVTTKRDSYITSQPKLDNGRRERALAAIMKSNSGKKPVRVHLLTGDSILLVFDAKAAVKDVFEQVCTMYSIKESHFFGLSAVVENEHRFMDLKQRLSKYAPKEWGKELKRRASDLSIQPSSVFTIQFQVQYYVEHPRLICNQESRHHYYLQLKRNVLQSKVATKDETLITLAASSLHLDMGTFDPSLHSGRYFDPHEYVPTWFVKKWGVDYFWSHLPALHKEMVETTPFNVQAEYIKQASCIEDVPVHYYKLYKTKKESSPSVLLGIYHQGIRIHHLAPQREEGAHLLDFEFPWNKVGRLFFAAKRFEIYPEDLPASRRLTYYTGSHTRSKYLLRLLRETHSLYMSLTPFVQHLRKLDGRTTKRKYRESYISGKNLEFDGSGSTDERMIGGAGELSPQSNDSKSVLLEKLYKSYTSSTSRGSSHTSGIESDSKQRNEVDDDDDVDDDDAAQMQDNAFVDDFDPIELDAPSSAGVICVTEAHLEAPQHKSLSVSDLTEQLAGATVARQSPSVSETTHSELTLKEEVFDFPEPTSHIDDVTNDVITEPRPLPEVVTPGKVILNSDTLPLKIAHVRESSSEGLPHPGALKHSRSHDALSYISSSETSAFSHVTARKDIPPTQLRSSKTYYDDTHTIPRQHNLSSTDHSNQSSTARSSRRSRDGNDDKSRRHRHRKRSSRDQDGVGGRMHRSASTETGLHQSGNRHRQKSSGKRHHRHKSLHDAKDLADQVEIMVDPASPHFGASLTAQKSLDDLAGSTNSLLSRSDRHNDIPYAFFSGPQDPMTDRLSSRPRVPSPPVPANDIIDSPTSHHRKMSDACQKTMAAQNRKLSDTKLPHERRRKSDAEPRYRPAHGGANGTAGHTPRKVEVLLQSSHEHRRRPVSCIVTSGTPRADTCYEAAKTSRPPAYIDGLNEVIV